jgi:hypothetical protein
MDCYDDDDGNDDEVKAISVTALEAYRVVRC